jgi:7-cyano-7-deazaguanine synthase
MVAKAENEAQTAVLCSAGLDSAVLLAQAAATEPVIPIYVSSGLAWEADERDALTRLLACPAYRGVPDPVTLDVDMRDVYPPSHWAIRGEAPGFDTPDEDVFIEGRNIILLSKTAVFMARSGLSRVLIGPLAGNPFPDATAEFFSAMGLALSLGLGKRLDVHAPLMSLHKADVIRAGLALGVPLELTLSCMQPVRGLHCGRCSKCRERRDAFREAGVEDRTDYASRPPR